MNTCRVVAFSAIIALAFFFLRTSEASADPIPDSSVTHRGEEARGDHGLEYALMGLAGAGAFAATAATVVSLQPELSAKEGGFLMLGVSPFLIGGVMQAVGPHDAGDTLGATLLGSLGGTAGVFALGFAITQSVDPWDDDYTVNGPYAFGALLVGLSPLVGGVPGGMLGHALAGAGPDRFALAPTADGEGGFANLAWDW